MLIPIKQDGKEIQSMNIPFIEMSNRLNTHRVFRLGEEPELLHIIKSGFEDRYYCFWEDAYEIEPRTIEWFTSSELKIKFDIDI